MAGRVADGGFGRLRPDGRVQIAGGGVRDRGGALARRRSPDDWSRRAASAQARLQARAAQGRNPVIVRNPRTGRRFAVSARAADAARRLLNEGRQSIGRLAG